MAVQSNASQLAAEWAKRAKRLEASMHGATVRATRTTLAESKHQLNELIYDKPVPTKAEEQARRRKKRESAGKVFVPRGKFVGKTGKFTAAGKKPAWKRTGNLKRSEKSRIISAYEGAIENRATSKGRGGKPRPYAKARHDKKNTRYPAPWRDVAIKNVEGKVRRIYRDAIRDAIGSGIIPGPRR